MYFVYPYKKKGDDFLIYQSIKWVKKLYPAADIFVIGDPVNGVNYIPHKKKFKNRGSDVTDKIVTYCRSIKGKFIYMNDDFFIGNQFNPERVLSNGLINVNPDHAPTYQEACKNTIEFLREYNHPIINYECHQPVMMDSDLVLDLFEGINYQDHNHFIKSMYFNVYPHVTTHGENLKIKSSQAVAKELLIRYGCFSASDTFLTHYNKQWISMY